MDCKNLLIEIGVEEIPSEFILKGITFCKRFFSEKLLENELSFSKIRVFSTPRRFALLIYDLQTKQKDKLLEKIGPSLSVAYKDNELTKAGLGFLKSVGASAKDIYFKQTPKGEKIAVKVEIRGKNTSKIISDIMPEMLKRISFPKSMRWNMPDFSFARPIRWIVALFGNEIIKFQINGLQTGNITYGNRFLELQKMITLGDFSDYERKLEDNFVIPDREKRKNMIRQQLDTIEIGSASNIIPNERLLDTVTDLVEYPTAVLAEFGDIFLKLPSKIIISTLSENQKYFAVQKSDGRLSNKFVFISNGNPEYSDIIRSGNEKVVRARLSDAEFYFSEDTKKPLENYVDELKNVLFEASLGNLFEKTQRIEKLTEFLIQRINSTRSILTTTEINNCLRAAKLCKADLVTLMLSEKEFTKLQGYIGMNYALKCGENKEVATAINEHYQPKGQNDSPPQSFIGSIVAIADKMDTVCGIIGIGKIPTSSNDPFALRRAANGIVKIIAFQNLEINIYELIEENFRLLTEKLPRKDNNIPIVKKIFKQRIAWFLGTQSIDYDVIQSVMHIDFENILDVLNRAKDLQNFKEKEDFAKLITGFKRVSNIIATKNDFSEPNPLLFEENEEKILYEQLGILAKVVDEYLTEKKYLRIMEKLVSFSKYADNFFDKVLVNTNNEQHRQNRYNLLYKIRKIFLKVADLARISIEKN